MLGPLAGVNSEATSTTAFLSANGNICLKAVKCGAVRLSAPANVCDLRLSAQSIRGLLVPAGCVALAGSLVRKKRFWQPKVHIERRRSIIACNLWKIKVDVPETPAELDADVAKWTKELEKQLTVLVHALPPEVSAILLSQEAQAAVAPACAGALLVGLLALRRGRQAWMEELPLRYDGPWIEAYWNRRPLRLLTRFWDVGIKLGWFGAIIELDRFLDREDKMTEERANELREILTDLGPTFVKLAQVWASRPDILPEAYQKELEKLLQQVRPFDKDSAFETLRRNIKGEGKIDSMFDDLSAFDNPIAAASIGQVYKAKVQGREVAVKVQRPDVREQVTLDLYVVRKLAGWGSYVPIEKYARQFQSLFELLDRVAPPFLEELDYENEADNQRRFASKMSSCDLVSDTVAVPEVLFSSREVLVQEFLSGRKLTEPGAAKDQAQQVVKVLLNSYMVQFLETGFLHGDPHAGNFVLMNDGKIGILDYGLMTNITEAKRVAFIEYIMHVQAGMYDECLSDMVNLGFLPKGIAEDSEARRVIIPGLANTLKILFSDSDLRVQQEKFKKQREDLESTGKLEQLREELQAIAKKYGSFRLPSYMTLVIRALATLEGLGLQTNDKFSLSKELFPYVARRLLTDDGLRIREALRAYLYKGRKRIKVQRINDLADGFTTFTNLMKGSRSQAVQAGAPRPMVIETEEKETDKIDIATQDIAEVIFSPQGNFLQDILIDEGVAAINALSRVALLQLVRGLGPFAFPITAPLGILLGTSNNGIAEGRLLTRDDKEALLLIRRIVQLIQGTGESESAESASIRDVDLQSLAEDLQKLQPLATGLLPAITPGAAAFAERFARQLASRSILRLADDVERGSGVQRTQPLLTTA